VSNTAAAVPGVSNRQGELPASSAEALRVCMIISSFRPLIGGAERVTERLCAQLRRQGVDVLVLTRRYPGLNRREEISRIPVLRLGYPSRSKLGALVFAVHALWLLATRLRRYALVHVQSPDTPLLVGFVAKLVLKRRLLVTIQSDPEVVFRRDRLARRARPRLMGRLVDVLGVQNAEMGEVVRSQGVPLHKIRQLPNTVDTSTFAPPSGAERRRARQELGLSNQAIAVLFVGRLVSLKRVDLLIRAWAGQPLDGRGVLIIVGDGPQREELRSLAREFELSDVRFEGATDDVRPYLHASDVFVLPSNVEGLSVALLEAMASGLCPVVSNLPANLAAVQNGKNGLSFPVDDLESLSECLRVTASLDVRRRLGARATKSVRDRFSLSAVADLHVQTYLEVLQ